MHTYTRTRISNWNWLHAVISTSKENIYTTDGSRTGKVNFFSTTNHRHISQYRHEMNTLDKQTIPIVCLASGTSWKMYRAHTHKFRQCRITVVAAAKWWTCLMSTQIYIYTHTHAYSFFVLLRIHCRITLICKKACGKRNYSAWHTPVLSWIIDHDDRDAFSIRASRGRIRPLRDWCADAYAR